MDTTGGRQSGPGTGWGKPFIDGELPKFWKPEQTGEHVVGQVLAVRQTKEFDGKRAHAIVLMGYDGRFSIPISASLRDHDWAREIGEYFCFTYMGWKELGDEDGEERKVKVFVVQRWEKRGEKPF